MHKIFRVAIIKYENTKMLIFQKLALEKSRRELILAAKLAVLSWYLRWPLLGLNTGATSYFSTIKAEIYLFFSYSFILNSLFMVLARQDLCDTVLLLL